MRGKRWVYRVTSLGLFAYIYKYVFGRFPLRVECFGSSQRSAKNHEKPSANPVLMGVEPFSLRHPAYLAATHATAGEPKK